jgi:hypothetical protein
VRARREELGDAPVENFLVEVEVEVERAVVVDGLLLFWVLFSCCRRLGLQRTVERRFCSFLPHNVIFSTWPTPSKCWIEKAGRARKKAEKKAASKHSKWHLFSCSLLNRTPLLARSAIIIIMSSSLFNPTHAVFSPASHRPTVARRPAPPAPTTTASYAWSTTGMPEREEEDAEDERWRRWDADAAAASTAPPPGSSSDAVAARRASFAAAAPASERRRRERRSMARVFL